MSSAAFFHRVPQIMMGLRNREMTWNKYTIPYTAFEAAATTDNYTVLSLPPRTLIEMIVLKHSAIFDGGAMTAFSVTVGVTGDEDRYGSAHSIGQGVTVADDAAVLFEGPWLESFASSTDIKVFATATGANCSALTTGSLDVWIATSRLPG